MNKQIEELKKDLGIAFQLANTTSFGTVAESLVEFGYQKVDKDSVSISKAEFERLYDEVWGAYVDGENNAKVYYENIKIPQVRKETVEKFATDLKNSGEIKALLEMETMPKVFNSIYNSIIQRINELAKQYEVEIKE